MASKKQRVRRKMMWIYGTHGAGTTGHRKTECDTYQGYYNLSNTYVSGQWMKMRADACK